MKYTVGTFKVSITPQLDENDNLRPQLIITNLIDKWSNEYQVELIDFTDTEEEAIELATQVITELELRDQMVEEEIIC